jgi:hypothetical protein
MLGFYALKEHRGWLVAGVLGDELALEGTLEDGLANTFCQL